MARDIAGEVRRVIHEQLDVDDAAIKAESNFIDDLGADSLAIVELVLKLEETFGVSIPESETEKIRTVQDAIAYIEQHAVAA
jgi:acyl carrier protein